MGAQGYFRCPVPLERIMLSPAFRSGLLDAALGAPFDSEYEGWDTQTQHRYERGRQFAIAFPGTKLMTRKQLSSDAKLAYRNARERNWIL